MVLGSHANPLLFRKPGEGKSVTGLGTSQRRGADDGDASSASRAGVATPERGFRLWPPQVTFDAAPLAPLAARARGALRGGASLTPAVALWRNHRLFTIAACLSVIPRVIAALGFKPALLIQDSFSYMKQSVQLLPLSDSPGPRPAGAAPAPAVPQPAAGDHGAAPDVQDQFRNSPQPVQAPAGPQSNRHQA